MTEQPAFPSHGSMGEVVQEGMSLRAYIATAAMQGILANHQAHPLGMCDSTKNYVSSALKCADALLAELAKGAP